MKTTVTLQLTGFYRIWDSLGNDACRSYPMKRNIKAEETRARICKILWNSGIDYLESLESIPVLLKSLQFRAQCCEFGFGTFWPGRIRNDLKSRIRIRTKLYRIHNTASNIILRMTNSCLRWEVSEWTRCTSECTGLRTRTVQCLSDVKSTRIKVRSLFRTRTVSTANCNLHKGKLRYIKPTNIWFSSFFLLKCIVLPLP
jgi:hypothetical protein